MATMNISLPEEMKSWVEEQATGGLYSNSSDYVETSYVMIKSVAIRLRNFKHLCVRASLAVRVTEHLKI